MNKRAQPLPPMNALRVLEVAARHLNFRIAAEELGVTQAAVAQQIRGLEASLELKLFDRQPRGLILTDAGKRYSVSIRHALDLISEATLALRPGPAHLTISVTPTFASKWLIPKLASLTAVHPEIDLRVLATERLSHFQTDGVDIAVRYGSPPFGPGLNSELLIEQKIIAVGSPKLISDLGLPEDFDHLHKYLLLHDAHNFWPQFIARIFGSPVQAAPRNLRFNQTSLAIEAAIAGQGLALTTQCFVQDDIDIGRLKRVFEASLPIDSDFYLVWPRKSKSPDALATVRQWLMNQR